MTAPCRLVETLAPGAEPVTLDDLKNHLRLNHDTDNDLLAGLIAAARQSCEQFTGCALITRSYSLYLDCWPGKACESWWDGLREGARLSAPSVLVLPHPPLVSVIRINIYAEDNTATEYPAASYFADNAGIPGRIVLKSGISPPTPGRNASGIEIQFRAGYGATPEKIPAALRQGIRQLAAHLYTHRGDEAATALATSGAQNMFQPFKRMGLS